MWPFMYLEAFCSALGSMRELITSMAEGSCTAVLTIFSVSARACAANPEIAEPYLLVAFELLFP